VEARQAGGKGRTLLAHLPARQPSTTVSLFLFAFALALVHLYIYVLSVHTLPNGFFRLVAAIIFLCASILFDSTFWTRRLLFRGLEAHAVRGLLAR
jgi:hypothetical protein